MFDNKAILLNIEEIESSIIDIQDWTKDVSSVDDFVLSSHGQMKLNAVCMKLFAICENIKSIDNQTNKKLLLKYPNIEWKKIIGLREIIAHHYFGLDAEVLFKTLKEDIHPLLTEIQIIKNDIMAEINNY